MRSVVLISFVMLLSAGCLDAADNSDASDATSASAFEEPPEMTAASKAPLLPDEPPVGLHLLLDDCEGITTVTLLPPAVIGAHPPSGWDEDPKPIVDIHLAIFRCARLSLGPFERGDVTILFQSHENGAAPGKCGEGVLDTFAESQFLHQVWTDDRELLVFLQGLGMPAQFASFAEEAPTPATVTWRFTPDGGDESWLTKPVTSEANSRTGIVYKLFWQPSEGRISYLEWDRSYFRNGQDVIPVVGEIRGSLLHAPGEAYSDLGGPIEHSSVSAPIVQFGDMECEQPL